MALLLDDLLDVSRITRGRLELRKEYVDLHKKGNIDVSWATYSADYGSTSPVYVYITPRQSLAELDVDRDAQIVALWQGRPREQRRPADVDAFCQWLSDYAPWLVRVGADSRERIRTLLNAASGREGVASAGTQRSGTKATKRG